MESSVHFHKCLALAQGAFSIIKQLSPPGIGLAPNMNRRLAWGLILHILTYGADLLVPNSAMLSKMMVLWNRVLRWVTNCFLSTPVSVLACEACLQPLDSLLPCEYKMASFRMACSSPLINLAVAKLPATFPSPSDTRARDWLRHLLRGLRQNYIPLRWDQQRPVPAVRFHLPINALYYTLRPVVAIAKTLPLLHPHLLPIGARLPPDPPLGRSYRALKILLKGYLLQDWSLQSPPPLLYPYSPTLVPHPFMGLDRFTAGRIHQMRSGKSYLKAHPN